MKNYRKSFFNCILVKNTEKKVGNKPKLNNRRQTNINEIRDNPSITTSELPKFLEIRVTAVDNSLAFLKENKYIERFECTGILGGRRRELQQKLIAVQYSA